MSATTAKRKWDISGTSAVFSDTFTLSPPSGNTKVTFVLGIKTATGTSPTWEVILQKNTGSWVDHATLVTAGTAIASGTFQYPSLDPVPTESLRLKVTLGGTSPTVRLDAFACDAAVPSTWVHSGHLAHRIDAMGGPVAKNMDAMRAMVENGFRTLVTMADDANPPVADTLGVEVCVPWHAHTHPCQPGAHESSPQCPMDSGTTTCNIFDIHYFRGNVDLNLRQYADSENYANVYYVLASRFEHKSLSSTVVGEVATDAGTNETALRLAIDRYNASADAALKIYSDLH